MVTPLKTVTMFYSALNSPVNSKKFSKFSLLSGADRAMKTRVLLVASLFGNGHFGLTVGRQINSTCISDWLVDGTEEF